MKREEGEVEKGAATRNDWNRWGTGFQGQPSPAELFHDRKNRTRLL